MYLTSKRRKGNEGGDGRGYYWISILVSYAYIRSIYCWYRRRVAYMGLAKDIKEIIVSLENRLSELKRIRNKFSRLHSDEYRDGINEQINVLDQVIMELEWTIKDEEI
jgi:hypothetical protein